MARKFSANLVTGSDAAEVHELGEEALDQRADAISIVSLIGEHDHVRPKVVEQIVRDLAIMCLPSGQVEPNREALRIDHRVDFGS